MTQKKMICSKNLKKKLKKKTKKPAFAKATARQRKKPVKRVSKKSQKTKAPKRVKITQEQIDALLKKGSERGFLTTSEILYALPTIEYNIEELEKVYDELKERGVEVKDVREFLQLKSKKEKKPKILLSKIDPIQMYLREIGRSSFLSAKEEKELAKKIEHGDEEAKNKLAL